MGPVATAIPHLVTAVKAAAPVIKGVSTAATAAKAVHSLAGGNNPTAPSVPVGQPPPPNVPIRLPVETSEQDETELDRELDDMTGGEQFVANQTLLSGPREFNGLDDEDKFRLRGLLG